MEWMMIMDYQRKQLAIVGNACIRCDKSAEIDRCDLVLRFNNASNCGKNGGRKTDILCVTNIYPPPAWIAERALSRIYGIDTGTVEVWFPRDSGTHLRHARTIDPGIPDNSYPDVADQLLQSNNFSRTKCSHFSREFNEAIFELLKERSPQPFMSPSTGFMAIEYALKEPRFAEYDKLVYGFSFHGWDGHAWAAEREILMEHTRNRNDFNLIDTNS